MMKMLYQLSSRRRLWRRRRSLRLEEGGEAGQLQQQLAEAGRRQCTVAAARTVAPAAMAPPAARRTNGSKVGELCALLDDAASAEFLSFAVEAGALALRGREAGVADRAKPAVVLEVWLARDLRLSVQETSAGRRRKPMWMICVDGLWRRSRSAVARGGA